MGSEMCIRDRLTGEHGFTQTFFSNARIPASGLMGSEGEGWKIAMRTLEYERGARAGQAGGYILTPFDAFEILELAKNAQRNGAPALDDPVIKDKLMELLIEAQGLKLCSQMARVNPLSNDYPHALALSNKLMTTEFVRRANEFAMMMIGSSSGYYVGDERAVDNGHWSRAYLNAFSATIGGGTSQIQRNIIGEHVLGLPKS